MAKAPKRPFAPILLVALLIAAGIVVYLGKDYIPATWLKSQVAPAPVIVEIKNINGVPSFSPSSITITQGATVKWVNKDSIAHTVTSDGTAKTPLNSPLLSQNQEFPFIFTNVGTFPYHCEPHPFMKATVIVEAPAATTGSTGSTLTTATTGTTGGTTTGSTTGSSTGTTVSAGTTTTPTTTTTTTPSPFAWFPPWWDKENYTLTRDATLDLKIAQVETVTPAPTCPTRPALTLPCPTGMILVSKNDSCGAYAVCETPPPSCPARQTNVIPPCPAGQNLVSRSTSDSCGAYTYTVCETPAILPTAPSSTTASPSQPHSAAKITYCFDDPIASMNDADWALVCEAKARGIISGTIKDGKSTFNPKNSINRAEAAKIITVGILKSLGKLSSEQFTSMDEVLKKSSRPGAAILFTDMEYNAVGEAPWFAKYVSLANREGIMTGYPDKSFKPSNTLNNVEAYKIIVETGRIASKTIDNFFEEATKKSVRAKEWFMKYVKTLEILSIEYSSDYGEPITRKEFLRIVMEVLLSAEL